MVCGKNWWRSHRWQQRPWRAFSWAARQSMLCRQGGRVVAGDRSAGRSRSYRARTGLPRACCWMACRSMMVTTGGGAREIWLEAAWICRRRGWWYRKGITLRPSRTPARLYLCWWKRRRNLSKMAVLTLISAAKETCCDCLLFKIHGITYQREMAM